MGIIDIVIILIIFFGVLGLLSNRKRVPQIFSHWHHSIGELEVSSQDFYVSVERLLQERTIPNIKLTRIDLYESHVFSDKREYLRVTREEHTFDICAAPFGKDFFISWWLGELHGFFINLILKIPYLGPAIIRIFKPITYYHLDSMLMFQESVHAAVMAVLDETTKAKGLRALTEVERKPILKDLFKR